MTNTDHVHITITTEFFPKSDWVTLEFKTEYNKIVTQDENEMIDYLFGLLLGDSIEVTDRSYIIIIDYTDGSTYSKWNLI